ncbi:MAG: hypothetical protein KAJ03_01860 [Gammaproteobacteria bacterium]|nr:hypothetical protein [Gammaproteobacteria bacterium]
MTVPKSWVDERVVVVHEDMLDELADCVAAFIMTTGAEPSTALASLVDFDADDIARGLDFHEKYVEAR